MSKRSFDKKMTKNSLVRQLIKEIKELGYSVGFVPSWRKIGIYDAMGVHELSFEAKKIQCTRYRKDGTPRTAGEVAFILAHELRHAIHIREGLYSAYYDRVDIESISDINKVVAVGVRAELDCDRYARERLKAAGVYTTLLHRRYPLRKVGLYLTYREALLKIQWIDRILSGRPTDEVRKKFLKIQRMRAKDGLCQKEK